MGIVWARSVSLCAPNLSLPPPSSSRQFHTRANLAEPYKHVWPAADDQALGKQPRIVKPKGEKGFIGFQGISWLPPLSR